MTLDRLSGPARAAILALHGLALVAGLAYAWSGWAAVLDQRAAVDQTRHTLDALDARLTGAKGRHAPGPAGSDFDPFVEGTSATVAGANMQGRVVAAIRAAGGTVTSSQVDTTGTGTTPPTVTLTVSCQLADVALQGLLYTLETVPPTLLLDQMSIDAAAPGSGELAPGGAGLLKISMVLSAYWAGVGKS